MRVAKFWIHLKIRVVEVNNHSSLRKIHVLRQYSENFSLSKTEFGDAYNQILFLQFKWMQKNWILCCSPMKFRAQQITSICLSPQSIQLNGRGSAFSLSANVHASIDWTLPLWGADRVLAPHFSCICFASGWIGGSQVVTSIYWMILAVRTLR